MNNIKISIIALVFMFATSSCLKTETPEPSMVVGGEWVVENVIADGQVNTQDLYDIDAKLHLDANNTFLFVNIDGRATAGTWMATETVLTLTGNDSYVQEFEIAYLDWDKMQIARTLAISAEINVEIRYLFRRANK